MGCPPFLPIILIKDQVLNFCRPGSILLGISWCKSFSPQTLHRQNKHAESWILSKRSLTVKPVVFYLKPAVTRNSALSRPDLEEKRLLVIILTNIDLFIVWTNIPQRGLSIVSLQSLFLEAISHESWTPNAKWQIWNNNCFFCTFYLEFRCAGEARIAWQTQINQQDHLRWM